MAKKPNKELIRALAEHIADDVIASHEAGHPRRKRLPMEFYKDELAKEDPRNTKDRKHDVKVKGKAEKKGKTE